MITRATQFKSLYPFYEAEEKRYSALTQRATILLGLVSGLALLGGISGDEVQRTIVRGALTLIPLALSGAALLISAFAAVVSLSVRNYKDVCKVAKLVVDVEENDYEEDDLYSILLANLADATDHNKRVNDSRACWLLACTIALGTSVVLLILVNLLTAVVILGD